MVEWIEQMPAKGEVFSLTCAFLWAVSVMFFRRAGERISAFTLNFFKNAIVFVLFVPTAYFLGHLSLPELSAQKWLVLALSGVIGICLADYLFFKALNLLGAGRNAIVACSYSLFTILFAFLLLGEQPDWYHWVGAGMVILGIVIASVGASGGEIIGTRSQLLKGIVSGLLAMAFTALGIILAKPLMDGEEASVPVVQVALIRLAAGLVGSFMVLGVAGRLGTTFGALRRDFPWGPVLAASLVGGYLAMFIWLAGYKYATGSTAGVLNQTSTLFTVALAAVFLKERLTPGKCLGTLVAFGGVTLILLLAD